MYIVWVGFPLVKDYLDKSQASMVANFPPTPISDLATQIRSPQDALNGRVVHILIEDPLGPADHQRGFCTGSVVGPSVVLTAGHCLTETDLSRTIFTITPGMYENVSGESVKPFGVCHASPADPDLASYKDTVGTDQALLNITECTQPDGTQYETQLRNIGDRTGVLELKIVSADNWWKHTKRPLFAYGYPQTDTKGLDTENTQLFKLPTFPAGNQLAIEKAMGPNARVWDGKLTRGASGGPVVTPCDNQLCLIATVARMETLQTSGVYESGSGPGTTNQLKTAITNQP